MSRDPGDRRSAIDRILDSIPEEIRYRTLRNAEVVDGVPRVELGQVAPRGSQTTLFEMESRGPCR